MEDLEELYQEIILSHNRSPRNEGRLDPRTGEAEGFNPLCGDQLTVHVREGGDGRLDAVRFTGQGCAISRASASIMTQAVQALPRAEVDRRIAEALEMLTGREEPEIDLDKLGELAALAGVRQFPARIKCATLAWHALAAALKGRDRVTTEEG